MKTSSERLWAKVEVTEGCWNWLACKSKDGYGLFRHAGQMRLAHRVAYELSSGSAIREGYEVDHLCHNRACVNPSHLQVVTKQQNRENLSGARRSNLAGVRGVSWNTRCRKWEASVGHKGKRHYLGLFDSLDDAGAAARAKRNELFTNNLLDRM